MNIKIMVAAHKPYRMPEDSVYLPVRVGNELASDHLGFTGDNTGEHISAKNPSYCELTAIYWAYKNLEADYIGLAHYRRHFTIRKPHFPGTDKFSRVLTGGEAAFLLNEADILVPKLRNYYIETNYSHYIHAHHREGLDMAGEIIRSQGPDFSEAWDTVMNRTGAHMFNMFIMKKEYFHDYCSWLFAILFQVEKQLDISYYDPYEARVFGFIGELMLDVYLTAKNLSYQEVDVMFMEKENWFRKGGGFLQRKFKKPRPS